MDESDVHSWAVHSPYSPLNLQDLPQPTPRDVPAEEYGHLPFTFRDAFEELLIAGSGFPLRSGPELARRMTTAGAALSFPHHSHFEERRGFHVAHWVDQLGLLGLWDAYFHLNKQPGRWDVKTWRPGFGFGFGFSAGAKTGLGLEPAETEADRMFFRLPPPSRYRAAPGEQNDERVNEYFGLFPLLSRWESTGLWDAVWRLGLERDGRSGEWTSATTRGRRRQDNHNNRYMHDDEDEDDHDDDNDDNDDDDDDGRDADVEDELYAPRRVTGAGPNQPSRFHHHHLPPLPPSSQLTKPPPSGPGPEVTTRLYPDGSKTVTAVERRQKGGKTETTTSIQHFGPDGVLVSDRRETSTTRAWSGSGHLPGAGAQASMSWSFNSASREQSSSSARAVGDGDGDDDENNRDGDDDHKGDGKGGKNGWFWGR